VVGNPDVPFLTIQFPGDLVSGVADIIDESDAQEILPEEALPTGSEDLTSGLLRREAAVYVLDQQDNELMGEVEYEMSKVLSSTETSFGWRRTAKNTFAGFDVQRKVFPYRDRFDIAEFDAATRAVVAVGNSGANYLKSSIIGGILTTAEPLSDSSSEPDLKSFQ
jgi:hypothetical protein